MVLNPIFLLPGTDHSLKVQARMEDKVRIKNLKSLLTFFEKFSRVLWMIMRGGKFSSAISDRLSVVSVV